MPAGAPQGLRGQSLPFNRVRALAPCPMALRLSHLSVCCLATLLSGCHHKQSDQREQELVRKVESKQVLAPPSAVNPRIASAPPTEAKPRVLGPKMPLKHVFVIALENQDARTIVGNTAEAPFFNSLLAQGSSAANFVDQLPPDIPSEPHYVWMEAGTNAFSDHTFRTNDPPSASNSTDSTEHLSTQLDKAKISWMSYQEGLSANTGSCPIEPDGFYQPKHNPFIFFRDVSGSPPSKTNARCSQHHRPYSAFATDLKGDMAAYVFITPDQCHDMHGQSGCPEPNAIKAGDAWLSENLPPLLAYANANAGVIFLVFDESEETPKMPFLALGPSIRANHVSQIKYTHSSLLKTLELTLGVPVLETVKSAPDFADLFANMPY